MRPVIGLTLMTAEEIDSIVQKVEKEKEEEEEARKTSKQ